MGAQGWVTAWSISSYIASAGEVITVNATLKNVGDDFAWFYARLSDQSPSLEPVAIVLPPEGYRGLQAGQSGQWQLSFVMPNSNVTFRIAACRWNGSVWVDDDKTAVVTISLRGAGAPVASVLQISTIPSSAQAGSVINIDVTLKNVGSVSGLLQPWVRNENVSFDGYSPSPFWVEVAPGDAAFFKMRFTMPSFDAHFWIVAQHWDGSGWAVDQWYSYYTVTVSVPTQGYVRNLDCNYVRAT